MRVFLTGGTGFVGAHTVRALCDAGHAVRLLVRDTAFAEAYYARHGLTGLDLVVGDMCDAGVIREALSGCDAVMHAAAVVSLDPRRAAEIREKNLGSMPAVIGTAIDAGIDNILYVSSFGALFDPAADTINEDSPIASPRDAYSRSKAECEAWVREAQAAGAPVQVTYPVGVFGPDDPRLSESNHALMQFLTTMVPITTSGIQPVDVRDVAEAHRRLLERGPRESGAAARFILGGHFYPWAAFADLLDTVTGRRVRRLKVPGAVLRVAGRVFDGIKRVVPVAFPMTTESMTICTRWVPARSTRATDTLGLTFRPGETTFRDTIRWLVAAGHLNAADAGQAVPDAPLNP